jgi:integrase
MENNNRQLLKRMETDMRMRGMSEHTQRDYVLYAGKFPERCGRPEDELNEADARTFLVGLLREGRVCAGTVNSYNAAIRFFFAVTLNRTMNYLQLPRFKKRKTLLEIPTREEVNRLINECSNVKYSVFFLFAYGAGLRVSEIARCASKTSTPNPCESSCGAAKKGVSVK